MNSKPEAPLSGCGVAITRPPEQAYRLVERVRAAGGTPISFPLLEIVPIDDFTAFDEVISRLSTFDWALFISSNAVQHGLSRILINHALPPSLRYAAVGPMTAAELAVFGLRDVLIPQDRFDSESLLNLPEMQDVAGKRCVIFRGRGGRELLAQTLRERGAFVEFAECYRRINPQRDAGEMERLWQNGSLQAMVVTSSEALRNLLALTGSETGWLKATPLFVNHPRIAETARQQGLQVHTASGPGDAGMLDALIQWRTGIKP